MNLFGVDIGIGDVLDLGSNLIGGNATKNAVENFSEEQMQLAREAMEMQRFKPYAVQTGFGRSWFDPTTQQAGYTLDPAMQAYRDQLMGLGSQALPQNLQDPQQAAIQYRQDLMQFGGPTAAISNRYTNLAGQMQAPTNVGNIYSGISAPQYGNLNNAYSGISAGTQMTGLPSQIARQYTAAGSELLGQQAPTADSLYNQMRAIQRPDEDRARSRMEQGLFGSGRLGMKLNEYGGTPEQFAFEKAQQEAQNVAAFNAINQADQLAASQRQQAANLSQMGLGAAGVYNQGVSQQFGNQMALAGGNLAAQQAQNAMLGQQFGNQMSLAGANLNAQQAQAGLYNQAQQNALNAYAQRLNQAGTLRSAAQAEQDAAIARGTGLFQTGIGVEQLGLTPLDYGSSLGAQQGTAGGQMASTLMQGGGLANQAALAGSLSNINMYSNMFNPTK